MHRHIPMRLLAIAMAGLASATHVAWSTPGGAQCRADSASASSFGPRPTAADSGRLYSYVLSRDGREFYFFKRVGSGGEDYRIFRSLRTGSGWGLARQVALGGDYSDLYPSLSPDGARLTFSSYRPAPGDTSRQPNAHLWMARREGDGWGQPQFVAASRLGYYHSGLTQDGAGNLQFRLTTPDWREQKEMELRWSGSEYAARIIESPLHPAVEYWRRRGGDTAYVWGAVTGADSVTLLQVSRVNQPDGRRAPAQYFLTYPLLGGWTPLVRAGGGLGVGAPNFLGFSSDGCYLHYTRGYSEFMRVSVRAVMAGLP